MVQRARQEIHQQAVHRDDTDVAATRGAEIVDPGVDPIEIQQSSDRTDP